MKAEARMDDGIKTDEHDGKGDEVENNIVSSDDYSARLAEMVNEAMEEGDGDEEGDTYGAPTEDQSRPEENQGRAIDEVMYTPEEIEKLAQASHDVDYAEVAESLGDDVARKGFQATGAYYPSMAVETGTVAYSRKIRPPIPGSWVMGDELLENMDDDTHIARILDGHIYKLIEKAMRMQSNFSFPSTTSPEEYFQKLVKLGHRMDTWGRYHLDVSAEERWEKVEKYFPLTEDGTPVPMTEKDFGDKRFRYLDYVLFSTIIIPIAKRCIEGTITMDEFEAFGKKSDISKFGSQAQSKGETSEAVGRDQEDLEHKRSNFVRRLLRHAFPEVVAYKYNKLREDEDSMKILSIPANWVVSSRAVSGTGKSHIWDHIAVYFSGHDLLPDTRKKIGEFSQESDKSGRKVPWYFTHLLRNVNIMSLGSQPSSSQPAEEEKKDSSKKRTSSRTPSAPPASKRETQEPEEKPSNTQTAKGSNPTDRPKGKSAGKAVGKGKKGEGSKASGSGREWYQSYRHRWGWDDYDYDWGDRRYWR